MQSSTERATEEKEDVVISNGLIVCLDKNSDDIGNSQSTLCAGISKKLKVKSNRGRPRKKPLHHRNPFEIGSKLKFNKRKSTSAKIPIKKRRGEKSLAKMEIIPTRVVGSSVKEALEILATAENMGLLIQRDRNVVIKEIANRIEAKNL